MINTFDPMNDLSHATKHSTGWTQLQGQAYNDWWLEGARARQGSGTPLVSELQTHFYVHEVDIKSRSQDPLSPYTDKQLREYPEAVLAEAVGQARAAAPGVPVILGETGMKAPKADAVKAVSTTSGDDNDKNYDFASDIEQPVRMADLAVQEARAGVDGAMAWCLDGYDVGVSCGMWDHDVAGAPPLRPWFYTWSLLCRYLPAGSKMYAPPNTVPDVRLLQAQLPKEADGTGGGWTFVLVNRGTSATDVTLTAPTGTVTWHQYAYQKSLEPQGNPRSVPDGFPLPTKTFNARFDEGATKISVPADSMVLLTTDPS